MADWQANSRLCAWQILRRWSPQGLYAEEMVERAAVQHQLSGPNRALLNDRVGARLPRSYFQRLASRMLVEHGLTFVDEWPVHDSRGRLLAELDLADVALGVGVECQSWQHHGSPADKRKDTARKRKLRALGWEIVELWWSDLERMDDVVADIRTVVDRARAVHGFTV